MGATRKFQVFISSTFEDLEEERRLVMEQVLNARHIPVGMELFQAGNDEQWEFIRRRIDECDYYLVILAERYGASAPDGMSYTEKEYRYARENNIPVAALLISSKAQAEWPKKKLQPEHKDKLEAFKAFCSESKLVKFWDDPKDLALKALHALNGMIEDHPRPGLVPATEAASTATIAELARLSEENNKLRSEAAKAKSIDPNELSTREKRIVKAMKKHSVAEALKENGLEDLGKPKEPAWTIFDLFCQIASSGWISFGNDEVGAKIAALLETPMGTKLPDANDPQFKTIKDARYQLGYAINDRFATLGLLIRLPTDNNVPKWSVSDLGWKIIRDELPPEHILLNW